MAAITRMDFDMLCWWLEIGRVRCILFATVSQQNKRNDEEGVSDISVMGKLSIYT